MVFLSREYTEEDQKRALKRFAFVEQNSDGNPTLTDIRNTYYHAFERMDRKPPSQTDKVQNYPDLCDSVLSLRTPGLVEIPDDGDDDEEQQRSNTELLLMRQLLMHCNEHIYLNFARYIQKKGNDEQPSETLKEILDEIGGHEMMMRFYKKFELGMHNLYDRYNAWADIFVLERPGNLAVDEERPVVQPPPHQQMTTSDPSEEISVQESTVATDSDSAEYSTEDQERCSERVELLRSCIEHLLLQEPSNAMTPHPNTFMRHIEEDHVENLAKRFDAVTIDDAGPDGWLSVALKRLGQINFGLVTGGWRGDIPSLSKKEIERKERWRAITREHRNDRIEISLRLNGYLSDTVTFQIKEKQPHIGRILFIVKNMLKVRSIQKQKVEDKLQLLRTMFDFWPELKKLPLLLAKDRDMVLNGQPFTTSNVNFGKLLYMVYDQENLADSHKYRFKPKRSASHQKTRKKYRYSHNRR